MTQEASNTSFLSGINAEYVAHLYAEYLSDPSSVDQSWQDFFNGLDDNETALLDEMTGASWTPDENRKTSRAFGVADEEANDNPSAVPAPSDTRAGQYGRRRTDAMSRSDVQQASKDSIGALMLIRAYRARGHMLANLDPLGLKEVADEEELDPKHYGFGPDDGDREIFINGVLGREYATLNEIIEILKSTYCGTIGVEFLHLSDPEEKAWVQKRIEGERNNTDFTVN